MTATQTTSARNLLAWSEGYNVGRFRTGNVYKALDLYPDDIEAQREFSRGYMAGLRRARKNGE